MSHNDNPILEVGLNDDFNTGREKWNANDVELEARYNSLHLFNNAMYFENKVFSEAEVLGSGWKFLLSSFDEDPASAHLTNGSVVVLINGLYYLSKTDQTDGAFMGGAAVDFHIGSRSVTVHSTDTGGTINLQNGDQIGIYFQKT